jgi:hypothetical protein
MRGRWVKCIVLFFAIFMGAVFNTSRLKALSKVSAEKQEPSMTGSYRVLQPLNSGDLTIFPVVRTSENPKPIGWQYLTLDEGLKNGEVVVTEAGQVRGLVRTRRPGNWYPPQSGDEVNQLVLINNSSKPLVLLAGEIVTGGKQDRVIAKDRIVPPQSDPIDLSVFCVEPGRWVASSAQFGAAGSGISSFMVQPDVRKEAMVAQDQQRVWSAVGGAIHGLAAAASPGVSIGNGPATTSYAKAMREEAVQRKVDEAGESLLKSREQILEKLREEHAVGVVVAIRGEIVWADVFADSDLLAKYWIKLIRSYVAEALTSRWQQDSHASQEDAQRFLEQASSGHETSEGEIGVYRYSETRAGNVVSFALRALLPGTDFDVHISKARMEGAPVGLTR